MTMSLEQVLAELEALGSEKVRAQNRKAGAGDHQFGVKLGDLRKVAKKIKRDHALALALWETGNEDARFLATLVIDPAALSAAELDRLVRTTTFTRVADWLQSYVVKEHPEKEALRQQWMAATDPMALRAGWALTTGRVVRAPEGLDLGGLLDRLEAELRDADPAAQWTMNSCLGEIAIHHPEHRSRALALGEAVGLYRDWPVSKGCIPPYVPVWVAEMVRRQG